MDGKTPVAGVASCCLAVALVAVFGCALKPALLKGPPKPAPADTSLREPSLPEPYGVRSLRSRGNLRSEPTTQGRIVATLEPGTSVGLLGLESGWYNVRLDTAVGWVWAPLVDMNGDDQWEVAMSVAKPNFRDDSLFTAVYRDDRQLVIILDSAWRAMTKAQKEQVVTRTGQAWLRAAEQTGMKPAPEIRFMSNNDVEMARWHAFWGTMVKY